MTQWINFMAQWINSMHKIQIFFWFNYFLTVSKHLTIFQKKITAIQGHKISQCVTVIMTDGQCNNQHQHMHTHNTTNIMGVKCSNMLTLRSVSPTTVKSNQD